MKKKILSFLLGFFLLLSLANSSVADNYHCVSYSFWCGGYGNYDAGGGMGIACGSTNGEILLQYMLHLRDACGFGVQNPK